MGKGQGVGVIMGTVFLDVAAMGMLIPVLPDLLEGFVGGDAGRAAQFAGIVTAVSAALSFVCAPVLGALSDRFGRKPILLLGMVGPALTYAGLASATSLSWYVVGFSLSGVLGAILNTAYAYVADTTPYEDRAARFGQLGAAFGIGFIVGPLAGGFLGGMGLQFPFYVAAALAVINIVVCVVGVPESLATGKRRPFRWSRANPIASLGLLRRTPLLLALAGCYLLTNLANQSLYSTFVFSTTLRFGWDTVATGVVFTLMGVCAALSQGLLVGPVVKRLGERRSMILGLTTSALAFVAYAIAPQGWMIVAIIAVSCLAAVDEPAAQALVSSAVGEDEQGVVQGAMASLLGITAVVGPLVGTAAFAYFVSPAAPVYFPGAPFAAGAVLIIGSLLVAWKFVRPGRRVAPVIRSETLALQPVG